MIGKNSSLRFKNKKAVQNFERLNNFKSLKIKLDE